MNQVDLTYQQATLTYNPAYVSAPYEVSWLRVIRTRQRGVKPSKFKRRVRYLKNRYANTLLNEFHNYYGPTTALSQRWMNLIPY